MGIYHLTIKTTEKNKPHTPHNIILLTPIWTKSFDLPKKKMHLTIIYVQFFLTFKILRAHLFHFHNSRLAQKFVHPSNNKIYLATKVLNFYTFFLHIKKYITKILGYGVKGNGIDIRAFGIFFLLLLISLLVLLSLCFFFVQIFRDLG